MEDHEKDSSAEPGSEPERAMMGPEFEMMRQDSSATLKEEMAGDLAEVAYNVSSRRRQRQGGKLQHVWRTIRGTNNALPPSNPDNWPRPTMEDLRRRPNRIVAINRAQEFTFCDNFIKTSKYELWSFMPKFLAMEFHPRKKIANVYFLIVSCMQAIPSITSTFGYPILLLPLLFIVLIDMVFTIIEDVNRHKADATANATKTVVLDWATGDWTVKERWEVAVGDFVKVHNREEIPADMLLIGVHERYRPNYGGVCYVETKSLDGETNLKIRQVQKLLLGRVEKHEDLKLFHGKVKMEHPTKSIATFTGSVELFIRDGEGANAIPISAGAANADKTPSRGAAEVPPAAGSGRPRTSSMSGHSGRRVKEPITPDNLLLRGTVLRNTKWAVGLVISTGHDTKVMMSIAKAPEKSSHLNSRINTEIKGLATMLFLFCFAGGLGSSIWKATHNVFRTNVLLDTSALWSNFIVQFFYYLLLLYGFIPISLYVSQNFMRFFQAWFMDQDLDMYHERTDTPSRVRTMNLNEDLGQITHVFSDKTGTLTQNVMDFRKCTVGGKAYGKGMTEIGMAALKLRGVQPSEDEMDAEDMAAEVAAPHVNFYDPALFADLEEEVERGDGPTGRLTEFMTLLALCHTVIPERPDNGNETVLSASSPDDEALVLGAKYFGFEFAERIDTSAVIYRRRMPGPLQPKGDVVREKYEVLRILGFNSVRKRMSVVVRCPGGQIKVLSKGADTTMMPLLRKDTDEDLLSTTMQHLEAFALEGLRTLMVGTKDMSDAEFREWDKAYDSAINDLAEVALQQEGEPNRIDDLMREAEQGLRLMGGSAIEDKLQTGVGETIEKLIRGGVVVWVITGDKEETAINIAVACQLLWSEERMDRIIINTKTCPTPAAVKDRLLAEFERYSQEMAACSKDGRSCKPRCLVMDGAAFALIEDAPLTSLHGPLMGADSLASLAISSPPANTNASNPISFGGTGTPALLRRGDGWGEMSPGGSSARHRSLSATSHKTPMRVRTSGNNLQFRQPLLPKGTPGRRRGSAAVGPVAPTAPPPPAMGQAFVIRSAPGSGAVVTADRVDDGGRVAEVAEVSAGGWDEKQGEVEFDTSDSDDGGSYKRRAFGVGKSDLGVGVVFGDVAGDGGQGDGKGAGDAMTKDRDLLRGVSVTSVLDEDDGDGGGGDEEKGVLKAIGGGKKGATVEGESGVAEVEMVMDAGDCLSAKEALLQFAGVCQAVVGCRMSPDQKRQLVHLIKDNNPGARTLAIGDGANDVPMIQSAHVGVGISGQEGLQAVNASDYSLAQFRFLQKLLLCHGRFNYRRMSFASSYLFYKSVSWAVPLFLYAFWNGLSGQVFYDYVNSTMWALLYTGLPIVLFGVYDMDVLPGTALRYPWLYRTGVDDELLTKTFFWGWIAQGVLESCWVTIPLMFLQTGGQITLGETPAVHAFGQAAFQAMTLTVNMKIIFVQKRWHWVPAAVLTISTALMFGISWFLNASPVLIQFDWEWYGMQTALFQDPNYWAVTAFGVIGVLMRDVAWKFHHRWWHPKLQHVLIEMEKGHLKDIDLPESLRRTYSLHDVIQEDTSSRMSRMRTQSLLKIESHRDAVMQALGASNSGQGTRAVNPSSLSPSAWDASHPNLRVRVRGLDGSLIDSSGRPRSAGGRLNPISHMLAKSPLGASAQFSRRGRSAGSSPVFTGLVMDNDVSHRRSLADGGMGSVSEQDQQQACGLVRVGFAFSHDPSSNAHEIEMIMRNRPASIRRSSLTSMPPSRLPTDTEAFQAHIRALQAHRAITVEPPVSEVSRSVGTPDEPQTANEASSSSTVVDPRSARGSGSLFPPVGGDVARTGAASRPVSGSLSSFSVGVGSARAGMTAGEGGAGFGAPRVGSGKQQLSPRAAAAAAGGTGRLPSVPNAPGFTVPAPGVGARAAEAIDLPDIFCSVGSGRLAGASNADPFVSEAGI